MELTQLRYFKLLAENGNLRKTAEMLYITPSALSGAISRLEKEMNTELFDRVQGRIRLNDRGHAFLKAVSTALTEIEAGEQTVRRLSMRQDNQIEIVVTNSIVWTDLICRFLRKYPDIHISFLHCDQIELLEIPYGSYDFILCSTNVWKDDVIETLVLTDASEVMIAVSPDHPLADRQSISLPELKDERFLFPPKNSLLNTLYYQYCRSAGFEPNVLVEATYSTIMYLQKQGLGIVFTANHALRVEQTPETVFLRVQDAPRRPAQRICWEKKHHFNRAALLFREYAIEYWKEYSV